MNDAGSKLRFAETVFKQRYRESLHNSQSSVAGIVVIFLDQRGGVTAPALEVIGNFQDHLVLIRCLLDEVAVILRVSVMQKRQNPGLGHAVELRLLAQNIDLQSRRVVVQIGIHEEESRILVHLRNHFPGGRIDLVGIDPGHRVRKLPLRIRRCAGTDYLGSVLICVDLLGQLD